MRLSESHKNVYSPNRNPYESQKRKSHLLVILSHRQNHWLSYYGMRQPRKNQRPSHSEYRTSFDFAYQRIDQFVQIPIKPLVHPLKSKPI
ncbi:DUF3627 domain-containing protein [Salmonella enterica subsp. enterica]|nr:DUF3627 domain-containing protein [Salmonella enterica subsp. enterica]EDV1533682.1 DUF3627 domain-containing protein [Salmonella enterica subsp. enterica]